MFILILFITINVKSIPIEEDPDGKNDENSDWEYEKSSLAMWPFLNGSSCGGKLQSPIDISFTNLTCNSKSLKLLQLNEYEKSIEFKFIHDGRTIMAYPRYEAFPHEIDGGLLTNDLAPYQLKQFHFHWGEKY